MTARSSCQSPSLKPSVMKDVSLLSLKTLATPTPETSKLNETQLQLLQRNLSNGQLFYVRRVNHPLHPRVKHRQLPRGVDCPTHWPWQYTGDDYYSGEAFQYREGRLFVMATNKRLNWTIDFNTGNIHWESTHAYNGNIHYVEPIEEEFIIEFITRIGIHVFDFRKERRGTFPPLMRPATTAKDEELRLPNQAVAPLSPRLDK